MDVGRELHHHVEILLLCTTLTIVRGGLLELDALKSVCVGWRWLSTYAGIRPPPQCCQRVGVGRVEWIVRAQGARVRVGRVVMMMMMVAVVKRLIVQMMLLRSLRRHRVSTRDRFPTLVALRRMLDECLRFTWFVAHRGRFCGNGHCPAFDSLVLAADHDIQWSGLGWIELKATADSEIVSSVASPFAVHFKESFLDAGANVDIDRRPGLGEELFTDQGVIEVWPFGFVYVAL